MLSTIFGHVELFLDQIFDLFVSWITQGHIISITSFIPCYGLFYNLVLVMVMAMIMVLHLILLLPHSRMLHSQNYHLLRINILLFIHPEIVFSTNIELFIFPIKFTIFIFLIFLTLFFLTFLLNFLLIFFALLFLILIIFIVVFATIFS